MKPGRVIAFGDLPDVAAVSVAHLGPSDCIVVHLERDMNPEEMYRFTNSLRAAFPNTRGIIVPAGATLSVVRSA